MTRCRAADPSSSRPLAACTKAEPRSNHAAASWMGSPASLAPLAAVRRSCKPTSTAPASTAALPDSTRARIEARPGPARRGDDRVHACGLVELRPEFAAELAPEEVRRGFELTFDRDLVSGGGERA